MVWNGMFLWPKPPPENAILVDLFLSLSSTLSKKLAESFDHKVDISAEKIATLESKFLKVETLRNILFLDQIWSRLLPGSFEYGVKSMKMQMKWFIGKFHDLFLALINFLMNQLQIVSIIKWRYFGVFLQNYQRKRKIQYQFSHLRSKWAYQILSDFVWYFSVFGIIFWVVLEIFCIVLFIFEHF